MGVPFNLGSQNKMIGAGGLLGIDIGGKLIGSGMDWLLGQRSRRNERKWLAQQKNKENAQNMARWREQNRYNHPRNQMQRLKDAGVNPFTAFGSGSTAGNTGSAATIPEYSAPDTQLVQDTQGFGRALGSVGSTLAQYQDTKMKAAQTDNVASVIKKNEADAGLARVKAITEFYKGLDAKTQAKYAPQLAEMVIGNYQSQIDLRSDQGATERQKVEMMLSQKEGIDIDNIVNRATSGERIKAAGLSNEMTRANIKKAAAATDLTKKQQGLVVAQISNVLASTAHEGVKQLLTKAQRGKTLTEGETAKVEKAIKEIERRTYRITGPASGNIVGAVKNIFGNIFGYATQ